MQRESEAGVATSASNKMAADGMTIAWSGDGCETAGKAPSPELRGRSRARRPSPDRTARSGGDRKRFETLVQRYDRDVLRIALNILHRPEARRDVTRNRS